MPPSQPSGTVRAKQKRNANPMTVRLKTMRNAFFDEEAVIVFRCGLGRSSVELTLSFKCTNKFNVWVVVDCCLQRHHIAYTMVQSSKNRDDLMDLAQLVVWVDFPM